MSQKPSAPFPSRDDVLTFIRESPVPVGRREIARAFGIKGDGRIRLKMLLRDLEGDGEVERGSNRRFGAQESLPEVSVVEVTGTDLNGETIGRPVPWRGAGAPPTVHLPSAGRGHPALGPGDRVLVRVRRLSPNTYEAQIIRPLPAGTSGTVVGLVEHGNRGPRLRPADRRQKSDFAIAPDGLEGSRPGDLVVAEVLPATRLGLRQVRVLERLGGVEDPKTISLIAIHRLAIPMAFPEDAVVEAEAATVPPVDGRIDLRTIPLVTIDGEDARDFDDAVFAEPDHDPSNPGGFHLIVAIADVSFYVRPGSALDREAYRRGNSCYFPDRVVPMLPEALSNGICSLRPDEPRACLAADLWIDADGTLIRHRFARGLMRSVARLTYTQVQAAADGEPDEATAPLQGPVIGPLYAAYRALARARDRRGTLDLDLPERQVKLDADGRVTAIQVRPRYDSHRLIEEFMILANVAAAQELERLRAPCIYRVHDQPDPVRADALRDFLESMGYGLARGVLKPSHFTHVLRSVAGKPEAAMVNELILRSQAQAVYSPDNIGHFGLSLRRYAHFTSPIRRYADLLVHRSLVRALGLGPGALTAPEAERMEEMAGHISATERRAVEAERDALDRFTALYLSERAGALFAGRISGVTRFGLFVKLDETGADGLVPISTLPDDYYEHREDQHALVGQRWGRVYRLGARVTVGLVEADVVGGGTLFRLEGRDGADVAGAPPIDLALGGRTRRPVPTRGRASRANRRRGD